jgi:hypothetical protein
MTDDKRDKSGNLTPQDIADPSKHRQTQIFETDNRPTGQPPEAREAAGRRFETGEDMPAAGERTLGEAAGPDTTGQQAGGPDATGAVAPPAELAKPGASTKLGGTPSPLATDSQGRQGRGV